MSLSPGDVARRYFADWSDEDREYLYSVVEESDYSLPDWVEAFKAFEQWLDDRGMPSRPWREMAGYLHCCTHMASPGVPLGKLKVIVCQALTEFGFDFTHESQA